MNPGLLCGDRSLVGTVAWFFRQWIPSLWEDANERRRMEWANAGWRGRVSCVQRLRNHRKNSSKEIQHSKPRGPGGTKETGSQTNDRRKRTAKHTNPHNQRHQHQAHETTKPGKHGNSEQTPANPAWIDYDDGLVQRKQPNKNPIPHGTRNDQTVKGAWAGWWRLDGWTATWIVRVSLMKEGEEDEDGKEWVSRVWLLRIRWWWRRAK